MPPVCKFRDIAEEEEEEAEEEEKEKEMDVQINLVDIKDDDGTWRTVECNHPPCEKCNKGLSRQLVRGLPKMGVPEGLDRRWQLQGRSCSAEQRG